MSILSYKRFLLTVSILALAASIGGYLAYTTGFERNLADFYAGGNTFANESDEIITFAGSYCFPDPHVPRLQKIALLSALTFILLYFARDPLWTLPSSILTFAMYPYWYWVTQRDIAEAESFHLEGFDRYFLHAGVSDCLGALFTTILTASLIILAIKRWAARSHVSSDL